MKSQKTRCFALWLLLMVVGACREGAKQENNSHDLQITKRNQIDIKEEIKKWKLELLASKQIGSPCNDDGLGEASRQTWKKENPDQYDGLPSKNDKIKSVKIDFNSDHKDDLLLYFHGENCTGHNGGTKTYAKIIYSDGTSKANLMGEILSAIQSEYKQRRKTSKSLKETTNAYLETTTTIAGYHNGITGEFSLFAEGDPHCCPSYDGVYTYKLKEKTMKIEISQHKNQ